MSDCKRWEPLDDSTMRQSADGGWVLIGDYSFLKREAHILRLTCQDLQSQNAGLKAEVIRLQQVRDYEHYLSAEIGSMNQENKRLKAELERLTADNEQLQNRCDFLEGKGHE